MIDKRDKHWRIDGYLTDKAKGKEDKRIFSNIYTQIQLKAISKSENWFMIILIILLTPFLILAFNKMMNKTSLSLVAFALALIPIMMMILWVLFKTIGFDLGETVFYRKYQIQGINMVLNKIYSNDYIELSESFKNELKDFLQSKLKEVQDDKEDELLYRISKVKEFDKFWDLTEPLTELKQGPTINQKNINYIINRVCSTSNLFTIIVDFASVLIAFALMYMLNVYAYLNLSSDLDGIFVFLLLTIPLVFRLVMALFFDDSINNKIRLHGYSTLLKRLQDNMYSDINTEVVNELVKQLKYIIDNKEYEIHIYDESELIYERKVGLLNKIPKEMLTEDIRSEIMESSGSVSAINTIHNKYINN